jgi:hypothetical protein
VPAAAHRQRACRRVMAWRGRLFADFRDSEYSQLNMHLLGLEHGTPFGTMGKGRGRCENGASLHVVVCEKLH